MVCTKRLVVAIICGLLFGLICLGLASSGPGELAGPVAWNIVTSRILIGLAIGISAARLGHWAIHGLVLGGLFSVPLAFGTLLADNPEFSPAQMFVWTLVLGMVYGVLTEVITSVVFKAPQRRGEVAGQPSAPLPPPTSA